MMSHPMQRAEDPSMEILVYTCGREFEGMIEVSLSSQSFRYIILSMLGDAAGAARRVEQ